MDIVSDILKVLKLEGALFFNAEFSAPWCLYSRVTKEVAEALSPAGGHLIIFHLLTEGRAYARLEDGRREELTAGDIVIFPHGNPHYLGQGAKARPVDSFQKFAKNLTEGLRVARFGGGGEITRFVCGFMACDRSLSEIFLAGLPPIVRVQIGSEPSGRWIESSLRFSAGELDGTNGPGSTVVHAKLSELMFVETLRHYLNALPANQIGWLAAARDPAMGQALALIHKDPARQWTIADLARAAGSSRTRLSERFRHFLGESPMAYVGQWRLKLAAQLLESSDSSVAQIATSVGYGSEASFNRAFKREYHAPPAQYRRQHKSLSV